MIYSENLVLILLWLGYTQYDPLDATGDFEVSQSGGVVTLIWHNTDPGDNYYPDGPTPEDIAAKEKPWAAREKRIETKNWAAQLNSRAYKTFLPDAVDDMLTQDVRQACRAMVNNFAAEEGLSARVSVSESKDAFQTRPRFDLILKGGAARALMRNEINVLRDDPTKTMEDILAYSVDDANAATVWAADNAGVTPTLETRLSEYPADYDE